MSRGQFKVSTHAPARGATSSSSTSRTLRAFQLTRPRGARLGVSMVLLQVAAFQLTRPRGARLGIIGSFLQQIAFQLTRPRGARRGDRFCVDLPVEFQLTRPRGARPTEVMTDELSETFQLTRPRGARRLTVRLRAWRPSFNSRAREGRDSIEIMLWWSAAVSTHAPARGATSS